MLRAIDEIKPRYVIAENVRNLLGVNGGRDFRIILKALAQSGYDAEWQTLSSAHVGACHRRERLYLVAYADGLGLPQGESFFSAVGAQATSSAWHLAGTAQPIRICGNDQPPFPALVDGIPAGMGRFRYNGIIKAAGNSADPRICRAIFEQIKKAAR